jgi:hypothetical protein
MLNAGFASINISGQWHEFKTKVDANHPRVIVLRRLRCYSRSMRTLIATLIAFMLFATTPVVAGDSVLNPLPSEDGAAAFKAGDYQKAFRLLKPLAKQGDAWAQYGLGVMYDEGNGVSVDNAKAVHWYTKAAKQGQAD